MRFVASHVVNQADKALVKDLEFFVQDFFRFGDDAMAMAAVSGKNLRNNLRAETASQASIEITCRCRFGTQVRCS